MQHLLALREQTAHQFITFFKRNIWNVLKGEKYVTQKVVYRKQSFNWAIGPSLRLIQLVHKPSSQLYWLILAKK